MSGLPDLEQADRDAARRLREGDPRALDELMERWGGRLHAFLARHSGDGHTAMDLAQECFVVIWNKRGRLREGARFSTWMFGIAANLVRQQRRWRRRHPEAELPEGREEPAEGRNPREQAEASERAGELRRALDTLPAEQRTVLLLAEGEGMTHVEIAGVLGCTAKAVEHKAARAREALRRLLSRS